METLQTDVAILGGGLSAQIAAFYLQEFDPIIIAERGLSKKRYTSWYLASSNMAYKLLNDLNVLPSIKIIHVGYWIDNKLYQRVSRDVRNRYAIKTRGVPTGDAMNRGISSFQAFTCTSMEVFEKLNEKLADCRILVQKIKRVDINDHSVLCQGATPSLSSFVKYRHLISTIPKPVFDDMAGIPKQAYDWRTIGIDVRENFIETDTYEIVYFPELAVPWNRASKIDDVHWAVEFTLKPEQFDKLTFVDSIYYGKICPPYSTDHMILPQKGVHLIGRFAKWIGGYNTEHAIKDSLSVVNLLKWKHEGALCE